MPIGIFLVIHDEIKGPQIKCNYYKAPINLTQEFISKLYMTHAGFKTTSVLEMKFNHFKILSCYTGPVARIKKAEGILGIIFEEYEKVENLELFLKRNLTYAINNPKEITMKEIFTKRLKIYITLNRLYKEVKIQNIAEIMILQGNTEFQSFIIRLGINKISNLEMKINYQKLLKSQQLKDNAYLKLDLPEDSNIYFVIRMDRHFKEIDGLLTVIKPYLEKYFEYSLEIITLFFLPAITELGTYDINDDIKKRRRTNRSIIQELQKSKKYSKEFNKIINNLIEGSIYVTPIQYQE